MATEPSPRGVSSPLFCFCCDGPGRSIASVQVEGVWMCDEHAAEWSMLDRDSLGDRMRELRSELAGTGGLVGWLLRRRFQAVEMKLRGYRARAIDRYLGS